jgi:hypothetical protein
LKEKIALFALKEFDLKLQNSKKCGRLVSADMFSGRCSVLETI